MRVAIVVTHLLGSGHLARALMLARAFDAAGAEVQVLTGGQPAPLLDRGDIALVQLPPLRSDGTDFARLLRPDGTPADTAYHARRRAALTEALKAAPPDVLITELFPFGRRNLRDEFTHLLETARALPRPPLVCCSIRDILAPPDKPRKAAFADEMLTRYYDAVLVHSDPQITPLSLSWPVSEAIADRLHYTGYVAPPPPVAEARSLDEQAGRDEVLVSAGGGDVGRSLFSTALAAARQDPQRRWRLLFGGTAPDQRIAQMRPDAPANVTLEPARPDFRQMLTRARASVSLCGYNTAMDILQSGCRALFVPFDDGGEVEQGLRAKALARLPGIALLRSADLSATRLLDRLDRIEAAPPRPPRRSGFDGAAETARIVARLWEAQR